MTTHRSNHEFLTLVLDALRLEHGNDFDPSFLKPDILAAYHTEGQISTANLNSMVHEDINERPHQQYPLIESICNAAYEGKSEYES